MIEKMKMVYIVSSASKKAEMLNGLRELGLLHLAEKKAPSREATEKFESLSRTASALLDYAPDKKSKGVKPAVLSDSEFEEMYRGVLAAFEKKAAMEQRISADQAEIERIFAWGNFSPAESKEIGRAHV